MTILTPVLKCLPYVSSYARMLIDPPIAHGFRQNVSPRSNILSNLESILVGLVQKVQAGRGTCRAQFNENWFQQEIWRHGMGWTCAEHHGDCDNAGHALANIELVQE